MITPTNRPMTNEEFMALEDRVYRGMPLSPQEVIAVTRHARELQQKVFCGDILARAVESYLDNVDQETIPGRLQWMFATYVCAEPTTALASTEIIPSSMP